VTDQFKQFKRGDNPKITKQNKESHLYTSFACFSLF